MGRLFHPNRNTVIYYRNINYGDLQTVIHIVFNRMSAHPQAGDLGHF